MPIAIPSIIFGYLLATTAIIILVTRTFYPYHRLISLALYIASWVPFIILGYHLLVRHKNIVTSTLASYWLITLMGVLLVIFLYLTWVVFPIEKSPLRAMSPEQLGLSLKDDLKVIQTLEHDTENIIFTIKNADYLNKQSTELSADQKDHLKENWSNILYNAIELDILTQKYRTFYQINPLTKPKEHAESFLLTYLAFTTKYDLALQVTSLFDNNPSITRLLNEADAKRSVSIHSFDQLKSHLTNSNTIVRLSAGRLYLIKIKANLVHLPKHLSYISKHNSNIKQNALYNTQIFIKNPLHRLERIAFKRWFPLQKNIALHSSYIRATERDYFITPDLISQHKRKFLPGDILIERREWHATNVGIPGFWTHSALYTGTLDEMDEYFKDTNLLEGTKVSEHIKKQFPEVHQQLTLQDHTGFPMRVIEAKRPGVIFLSLEASVNADSLAVLHPNIPKEQKLAALLLAFQHFGKPYDFEFDFATDNALVCSELIYKAYQETPGITLNPRLINGRSIFSPNDFAKKFAEEQDLDHPEFTLALFLDGNEKKKTAQQKDAQEFSTTWLRPKWHVFIQK